MTGGRIKASPAYEKAYALAIRIVQAVTRVWEGKREFVMSKHLLRCGTSIGANRAEANAAFSDADLSAKVSMAYKESQRTKYWLSLLKDTGFIEATAHAGVFADVDEIVAI